MKASRVISVESDPENVALIERNVRLNGFSNVTILPKALSSESGTRSLRPATRENTGTSTVEPAGSGAVPGSESRVTVECTTLDKLSESVHLTRTDWLKIDVEGHEIEVLRGGPAALTFTRAIVLEVTESTEGVARRIVESAGFDLRRVEDGSPAKNLLLR